MLNLRVPGWFKALALLLFLLPLMVGLSLLMASDARSYITRARGTEDGLSPHLSPLSAPRMGINVNLEIYDDESALRGALSAMQALGFGTLRQHFSWADLEPAPGEYRWERWDRALPLTQEYGLQVIAVLDTSPAWARPTWEADNIWAPPVNLEDYARFVGAFAQRYAGQMTAYQVWDEPNIYPHWGNGAIDPAEYVNMLRVASAAIRQGDPAARVIAGGLAPNLETGGRNMSDVQFLHEIYRRGAGAYFDILGVQAYGFWTGPYDRRVDDQVLNFSRVILLRQEMLRRGDEGKPVWALEGGWCALPSDWSGQPSAQGSDLPAVQVTRLQDALARAEQEWPWMGLLSLSQWQPNAPIDDPIWGYAVLGPEGRPNAPLEDLYRQLAADLNFYPGLHAMLASDLEGRYWNSSPLYDNSYPDAARTLEVPFWGTGIALDVERGQVDGELVAWIDGGVPKPIALGGEGAGTGRVVVAEGLYLGAHTLGLHGTPQEIGAMRAIRVAAKPQFGNLWLSLGVGLLVLVWCGVGAGRAVASIPWRRAWGEARGWWLSKAPGWLQAAAVLGTWALVLLAPSSPARLAALCVCGLASLLRPDLSLLIAVASIPFAPLHVRVGPGSFALTEVSVLVAGGARLAQAWLTGPAQEVSSLAGAARRPALRPQTLDYLVLALVLLGLGTSFLAEYQRVAWREWRVIVAESAVLYALLRTSERRAKQALRVVDVLWLSGVAVALYALAVYPRADGVIEAEGVRRARAFYGSPNNLALYLERLLPLGLAMAGWGRTRWRRWLYGLGAIPLALALVLTFSRGAWLLGIPAGLLALGWARGRRTRRVAVAVVAVGALVMVPLAGVARFASLVNLSQGTGFLRVSLWQAAWDMVKAHPWLGVGLDNFLYYYGDYIRPGAEVDRWLSHPHNLFLDFWLRLGIGGLALVVAALVAFGARAWKRYRALPEGDLRAVTLGLMAGMVACVAHGLIDASYFVTELAFWFMFALAWVADISPKCPKIPANEAFDDAPQVRLY